MLMKKLLFTLIIAITAVTQAAAYDFEVDGIYYNKNGTNATVTFRDNNYNSYSGEVIIPDTVTADGVALWWPSSLAAMATRPSWSPTPAPLPA